MTKYGPTEGDVTSRISRQYRGSRTCICGRRTVGPLHAATEKILFQLDWIPFGRHTPYYAALEKGF